MRSVLLQFEGQTQLTIVDSGFNEPEALADFCKSKELG